MAGDWKAGLDDQDELEQYPSAANPLTAAGIDPDEARANPQLLARLIDPGNNGNETTRQPAKSPATGAPSVAPTGNTKESPSAASAGALGGAGDTPSPTAAPAAPQTEQDKLLGYGEQGLGLLNKNLQAATDETAATSTQPPEDVARLTAQQTKLETKTPLYDPTTGKMLDQYKPSTGSRIWRGVRGGLVGLLTGGIPGAAVGALEPGDIHGGTPYGAPNKQYTRAEQSREQQLAAVGPQLKTAMQTWKDVNEARKAKAGEYRANAALGKDVTTGATGLISAENKPETESNKTAAKLELDQKTFDMRRQQLSTDPAFKNISPLNRALYMANGKLPDPRETSEGDIQAANMARALAAFKLSHGGKNPATLEEFNGVAAAAKGDLDKGSKGQVTPIQRRVVADKKNSVIEKAQAEYAKKLYVPGAAEEFQRSLQEAQNAYEEDMGILGEAGPHQIVTVDKKGQAKWTPEGAGPTAPAVPPPAAAPPAAPAPAPVAAPAPIAQPPAAPAKPQPAPEQTRIKLKDGTVQVKRNGKWVNEANAGQ